MTRDDDPETVIRRQLIHETVIHETVIHQ